jgi:hypothetical protein
MLLSFTSRFDIDLQATSTSPAAKATSAKPAAADNSASASQVYYHDASVDFTI